MSQLVDAFESEFFMNFSFPRTVRCKDEFEQNLTAETLATMQGSSDQTVDEHLIDIWNDYCQLVDEISKNSTIGSDEKFQLFICLCLR